MLNITNSLLQYDVPILVTFRRCVTCDSLAESLLLIINFSLVFAASVAQVC